MIQSKLKPERIYIGSAVSISDRKRRHLYYLRLNKHHSRKLQLHYNKYGESDLAFTILELCFPEFLTAREQYFINKKQPYFNINPIAGSSLGSKRSIVAKRKNAEAHIGRKHSEETRIKISQAIKGERNPFFGKTHSEEARAKIGTATLGRKHTEASKKKMSEKLIGNKRMLGKHQSKESKLKKSLAMQLIWEKRSEETKFKMRQNMIRAWQERRKTG